MQITFIRGDRIGKETDYRDFLPVNMVAIDRPMFDAKGYMLQSPGLTEHAQGFGIDRGGVWNERLNKHFRVSGEKLIEVAADGTVTDLGGIPGFDTVSLPYSFNTQAIIANGNYYLYDSTNGLRQIFDVSLGSPIDGIWTDSVYFFTDGENIYHTDIQDESNIQPLDFATSEYRPDPSYGLGRTADNKVIVFNRYSVEYYTNIGSDNFLFQRITGRNLRAGPVGVHAKCELNDGWYILGGRKGESIGVHKLGVGTLIRASSREVEKIIKQYPEESLRTAVLESRTEDGYSFVIVHLPGETLQFNETIAATVGHEYAWSILKTDVKGDRAWRAKHGVFDVNLGKWVYGDRWENKIGILDDTVSTHYDELAEWLLHSPFVNAETMSIDELEVETLPGHTGEDDATVFVSLTYDGVRYGNEWVELYGEPSDYTKRFLIRQLGYVDQWVGFKLRGASRSRMAFGRGNVTYG